MNEIINSKYDLEKLKDIDLFVLDMDGTIYLGDIVLEGSREFIKFAKDNGKKIIYFTNNASKNKELYYEKLIRLGYEADRSEIMTSGDVTIAYLNKYHKGLSVYLVGTPELENAFKRAGIELTDGTDADIVITSFDTTLTYDKLVKACDLLRAGKIYYSTHEDINCPVENGFIPDSGAIAALVTASTGRTPKYFGKPNLETAQMIEDYSGISLKKTAIVGDRLYTDIALGKKHGILSILVLSGETKLDDVNDDNRADIILNGIGEIIDLVK